MQIVSKTLAMSLTVLSLAIASGGCTRSQKNVEIAKRDSVTPPPAIVDKDKDKASAYGTLDTTRLKEYTSNVDNLTFKFEYLTANISEKLPVTGNTATVSLKDLPAGQSGSVTFSILENGVVKLTSITPDITLIKGIDNEIKLVELQPPGSGVVVPGVTNATINVVLPGTSVTPSPSPTPTGSPSPVPTSWDGLADRGNEKWKIETVTQ